MTLAPGAVHWSTDAGSIASRPARRARRRRRADHRPRRRRQAASEADVRVLNPLKTVELSTEKLAIAEAGADGRGRRRGDRPRRRGLHRADRAGGPRTRLQPRRHRSRPRRRRAQGHPAGRRRHRPDDHRAAASRPSCRSRSGSKRWSSTNSTTKSPPTGNQQHGVGEHDADQDPEGLEVDFTAMRNFGVTATSTANRITFPGQPLRIRLKMKSSVPVPKANGGLPYLSYFDGNGVAKGAYGVRRPGSVGRLAVRDLGTAGEHGLPGLGLELPGDQHQRRRTARRHVHPRPVRSRRRRPRSTCRKNRRRRPTR